MAAKKKVRAKAKVVTVKRGPKAKVSDSVAKKLREVYAKKKLSMRKLCEKMAEKGLTISTMTMRNIVMRKGAYEHI